MTRLSDPHQFPHFIVQLWGGRLKTPMEYRGTSIAKQFESGRIGGRTLKSERVFIDTIEGRRALFDYLRHDRDAEVYWVRNPRSSRQRVSTSRIFDRQFVQSGFRQP